MRGEDDSLPWIVVWNGEDEARGEGGLFGSFRIKSSCMGEPGLSGFAPDSSGRPGRGGS